jgi:hypothetical protein
MLVRVLTADGQDIEVTVPDNALEVIVYTDTLVPLGKLDLR